MIDIVKNTVNYIYPTLQSNSLLFNESGITPYYLFEFINEQSNVSLFFVQDDISASSAKSSYSTFQIIETGSSYVNLTAGTINLFPAHYSTYKIYEQLTRNNLDPANTISVVNYGLVFVTGETSIVYTQYTGNTNAYITYNNNNL